VGWGLSAKNIGFLILTFKAYKGGKRIAIALLKKAVFTAKINCLEPIIVINTSETVCFVLALGWSQYY
jgi:hypothetical protein